MNIRSSAAMFIASLLVIGAGESYAQKNNYQRMTVAERLSIDIPVHWQVLDIDQRRKISSFSETIVGKPVHVALLAVHPRISPEGSIIRVSFTALEETLTQSDLNFMLRSDHDLAIKMLTFGFDKMLMKLKEIGGGRTQPGKSRNRRYRR